MKPDSTLKHNGLCWYLMDRLICYFVMPSLVIFLLLLIPGIPFGIYSLYKESKSPEFTLKKDEWTCTKTYIYYTYVKGIRFEHEACSNYRKE